MRNIEQILRKCENCKLNECDGCITYSDMQVIKARIKELEEENGTLKRVNNIIKNIDIENATQKIDDYYNEFMRNFIPKQKIKDKIEEYYKKMEEDNKNISWIITDRIVLNVLEELLQEEDK